MNARTLLAVGAMMVASAVAGTTTHSRAQGFAGLGEDASGFAPVVAGRPIAFPADHGAHLEHRVEWWYFTANLTDARGNAYGVQWTLFRQATRPGDRETGWASRQLWMAHAAVTSTTIHRFAERFARGGVGQAGVEADPFRAWIDNWQMRALPSAAAKTLAPLELTASAKDFSYTLKLESERPVVLQGEGGFSKKSERGQASYYYSQPYLQVMGTITLDGVDVAVTGQGWIDREWSSQPLSSDQRGWDWFSLHLESGDKLMLFRLRHADGQHFFAGNWIGRDGQSTPLQASDIVLTPTGSTRLAGRELPTAWHISVPSHRLELSSVPLNPQSWMDTRFKYWEGPVGVSGTNAGVGYLEMTGY